MKKSKVVLFIIIIMLVLIVPVIILANSPNIEIEDFADTLVIGSAVFRVEQGKTREERINEKFEIDQQYDSNGDLAQKNYSNIKEKEQEIIIKNPNSNNTSKVLEDKLEKIAVKYNRKDQFDNLINSIEKQEATSKFNNEQRELTKLFIDIYMSEDLGQDEKESIKEFLIIIDFNDIDAELKNDIQKIIN